MKLSLYTCVRNGLYYDYHVVEMVRHHLSLVDELVVFDGNSSDGTADAIRELGPKVKLLSSDWGDPSGEEWFANFKDIARKECSGDWCILLDPDEFIPEWEFERLRSLLEVTEYPIVRLDWLHFYGNYRVYNAHPKRMRWAEYKFQVHRNLPEMRVWGDGSNVRWGDRDYRDLVAPERFTCHHFGYVRYPSRLRQKLRIVGRVKGGLSGWFNVPGIVFKLFPYNWFDPDFLDDLAIYEGPFVKPVRQNPTEFTRDQLKLYRYLQKHQFKQGALTSSA